MSEEVIKKEGSVNTSISLRLLHTTTQMQIHQLYDSGDSFLDSLLCDLNSLKHTDVYDKVVEYTRSNVNKFWLWQVKTHSNCVLYELPFLQLKTYLDEPNVSHIELVSRINNLMLFGPNTIFIKGVNKNKSEKYWYPLQNIDFGLVIKLDLSIEPKLSTNFPGGFPFYNLRIFHDVGLMKHLREQFSLLNKGEMLHPDLNIPTLAGVAFKHQNQTCFTTAHLAKFSEPKSLSQFDVSNPSHILTRADYTSVSVEDLFEKNSEFDSFYSGQFTKKKIETEKEQNRKLLNLAKVIFLFTFKKFISAIMRY